MIQSRFKELEERNRNNPVQLCYDLFCEEKSVIPIAVFNQWFPIWLNLTKGGDINLAIDYFKNNKVK